MKKKNCHGVIASFPALASVHKLRRYQSQYHDQYNVITKTKNAIHVPSDSLETRCWSVRCLLSKRACNFSALTSVHKLRKYQNHYRDRNFSAISWIHAECHSSVQWVAALLSSDSGWCPLVFAGKQRGFAGKHRGPAPGPRHGTSDVLSSQCTMLNIILLKFT